MKEIEIKGQGAVPGSSETKQNDADKTQPGTKIEPGQAEQKGADETSSLPTLEQIQAEIAKANEAESLLMAQHHPPLKDPSSLDKPGGEGEVTEKRAMASKMLPEYEAWDQINKERKKLPTKDKIRRFAKSLLIDCVGNMCVGIGIYNFAKQGNFATGGIQGIALILNHLFNVPIGLGSLILNIPLILFAYKMMGRRFMLRTFQTLVVLTLATDVICPMIPVYNDSPLMCALFGAAFMGIGLGLIYQAGSSTGGTDLILIPLHKMFPYISLAQLTMGINTVIIMAGAAVFKNFNAFLFGMIFSLTMSQVMEKIMIGFSSGKMVMIISDKYQEINARIGRSVKRGTTILPALGGYSGDPKNIILTACTTRQMTVIHDLVMQIDPRAMMIIYEYNEIYGQGFRPLVEEK